MSQTINESAQNGALNQNEKFDLIAKGVGTGVVVSVIVHTGKSILNLVTKSPIALFGLGVGTGYLAHKYRKQIISSTTQVAKQGKDFAARQKENIANLIPESEHEGA